MGSFGDKFKFPFGKYKGWDIAMIPSDYLTWVFENCMDLDKAVRRIVQNEILRRDREGIYIEREIPTYSETNDGLPF